LSDVTVGKVVRVPLGGRRVRGYVVEAGERTPQRRLKDVAAVSGDLAVFDRRLLETLRWAAIHYVAPLPVLLGRAAPPNLPRRRTTPPYTPAPLLDSPLPQVSTAAARGDRLGVQYLLGTGPWDGVAAGLAAEVVAAERSVMVVLPTAIEASAMQERLLATFGSRVVGAWSARSAKEVTAAWVQAATAPGTLLVGTPEVMFWPVASLALAFVVEEGRRGMKGRQTPTLHVREVLRRRATIERFGLVYAGPVPTVEVIGAGGRVHHPGRRVWPLVEVVDRGEEPPGRGVIADRTRQAIRSVAGRGGQVFVLVNRRGYAPAFRCTTCRTVRRCAVCDAAADRSGECRRCGAALGRCRSCDGDRFEPLGAGIGRVVDELARSLGDRVGPAGDGHPVVVGTERDLAGREPVDLAVAVDADAMMLAPHYRAEEDALRSLGRLCGIVKRAGGRRCMIQTGVPGHRVLGALRQGDPRPLLGEILVERERDGFPPSGELVSLEVGAGASVGDELAELTGRSATLLGPASTGTGERFLIQGKDLRPVRVQLRRVIQRWRDEGLRVRVDADPIDL
jgi:primosomal protein N' (replication factor Y)